eukprot:TRINITY_DN502_c0_g1_i1.p1 TRINITY_DN502_c0_g1~~TRINITY_DN502_c0_g1_i1.p1  ORF type:complete len:109 (-),score=14.06 TRINITY_DN502_c0_g1_i1:112-396(-)
MSVSGAIRAVPKHKPLIKFVGKRPQVVFDPTKSHSVPWNNAAPPQGAPAGNTATTNVNQRPAKEVLSEVPKKYLRKPFEKFEMELVNSGGASGF